MNIVLAGDISLEFLRDTMLRRIKHGRKHVRPSTIVEYAEIIKIPESELKTFFEILLIKENVDGANVLPKPITEIALDVMIAQADPSKRKLVEDKLFVKQTAEKLRITPVEFVAYVEFLGSERQTRYGLA